MKMNVHGSKKDKYPARSFYVPARISRLIPEGTEFRCELTEDGVLFRRVEKVEEDVVPDWAQGERT